MSTQFYAIYRVNGNICGTPIAHKTTNQLRKEYDHCFDIPGRTAHFFLVTSDDTIGRKEAIQFATWVATGKVVRHHIDLSQINPVRKNAK